MFGLTRERELEEEQENLGEDNGGLMPNLFHLFPFLFFFLLMVVFPFL